MSSDKRPTSPHLSIYKPQITSMMSIMHRMTGVALYAGTALLVCWLWILAYAPTPVFVSFKECVTSIPGQILLAGWTFAFFYHLGNGIRHLFWDIGMGYELSQATRSGLATLVFAVLMTAICWNYLLTGGL